MKHLHVLSFLLLASGFSLVSCKPEVNGPLTVILVRHAEKVDHSKDPDLSREGYLRAEALAYTLQDAEIQRVHSSDYIRTRKTAAPVAELFDLDTEIYDPSDLFTLADSLRSQGGRHLVVGHSHTTPDLVDILGGEPGPPVADEWEYDRLYILTFTPDGVQTVLLRYGKPCSSLPSSIRASSLLVPHTTGSALKSEHTLGRSGRS